MACVEGEVTEIEDDGGNDLRDHTDVIIPLE
jgi:hypothetical protein